MAYPFVASAVDLGRASGPRLGMAWHMAEGGGTVGFLSRPNRHGVSVHFVVEYGGRVVQMLQLSHLHTSIRVSDIRTTDDAPYDWNGTPIVYGATAARGILGDWWKNPNNATIGVEVEGFAKDGPNAKQHSAMALLFADMADQFSGIRSLGHRDFADYKACPGKRIAWDRLGGHGPGDDMAGLGWTLGDPLVTGTLAITAGTDAINCQTGVHYRVPQNANRPAVTAALKGNATESGYLVDLDGDYGHFIRGSQPVTFTATQGTQQPAAATVLVPGLYEVPKP